MEIINEIRENFIKNLEKQDLNSIQNKDISEIISNVIKKKI